jgi:hypothetical protein
VNRARNVEGGEAGVEGPRQRCRAHNQYEARTLSEQCEQTMPDAPIEQKVRFALQRPGGHLGRRMSLRAPSPA